MVKYILMSIVGYGSDNWTNSSERLIEKAIENMSKKIRLLSIPGFAGLTRLGSGLYSVVYSAVHEETGAACALKQIQKSKITTEDEWECLQREVAVHRDLWHPHIVSWYGCLEDEEHLYFVMELAGGQTMLSIINMCGAIHEKAAQQQFVELISAVKYLHEDMNVIHRDIKLDNILYDHHGRVKLVDFGLCNSGSDFYRTQCGTFPYSAPEVFADKGAYTNSIDIWSCGIVLYAMLVGKLPFESSNVTELLNKIRTVEPVYPDFLDDKVVDLLKRMLAKDVKDRITLREIVEHPWVVSSPNYSILTIDHKSVDSEYVTSAVKQRMKELGRNADVDLDEPCDDSLIYRIIKHIVISSKQKISIPRLGHHRFSGSQVLPHFDALTLAVNRRRRKMSDGSTFCHQSPLAEKPHHVPPPLPRKCTEDITRSIHLPMLTFA